MVTLNAHFDGKSIVLDDPLPTPLPAGTRLRVRIESVNAAPAPSPAPRSFQPLDIHIDAALSNAIALDPEFDAGER